ncbi:MAG: hypothetical protein P1U32_04870 [Legionellaceae bacterium]|nr:hypothetical protein [Legionellaceae bacterium]
MKKTLTQRFNCDIFRRFSFSCSGLRMQLTATETNTLRLYLENTLFRADATHDLNHRLEIIMEECTRVYTYLNQKQVSFPEIPSVINGLLNRLKNRGECWQTFFSADHTTGEQAERVRTLFQEHFHNRSRLQQNGFQAERFSFLGKEDELIDELVQLVVKKASYAYVSKKQNEARQSTLSWLDSWVNPVQAFDEHVYIGRRSAVAHGLEYTLNMRIEDPDFLAPYNRLIALINTYPNGVSQIETHDFRVYQDQKQVLLNRLRQDCIDLFAADLRHTDLSTPFIEKLNELQIYIEAEKQGQRICFPNLNVAIELLPEARLVAEGDDVEGAPVAEVRVLQV